MELCVVRVGGGVERGLDRMRVKMVGIVSGVRIESGVGNGIGIKWEVEREVEREVEYVLGSTYLETLMECLGDWDLLLYH